MWIEKRPCQSSESQPTYRKLTSKVDFFQFYARNDALEKVTSLGLVWVEELTALSPGGGGDWSGSGEDRGKVTWGKKYTHALLLTILHFCVELCWKMLTLNV